MDRKSGKKILELFWVFFKIGAFTFGGGFAMIPVIEREIVEKKKWILQKDICDILAISQSFPGAIAINSATIIGYRIAGYTGAFVATLGAVIPSFLVITLIASLFTYLMDTNIVKAAFKGINSCVIALLILAAIRFAKSAIKGAVSIILCIAALLVILFLDIHPIYTIIFGIVIGLIFYSLSLIKKKSK